MLDKNKRSSRMINMNAYNEKKEEDKQQIWHVTRKIQQKYFKIKRK